MESECCFCRRCIQSEVRLDYKHYFQCALCNDPGLFHSGNASRKHQVEPLQPKQAQENQLSISVRLQQQNRLCYFCRCLKHFPRHYNLMLRHRHLHRHRDNHHLLRLLLHSQLRHHCISSCWGFSHRTCSTTCCSWANALCKINTRILYAFLKREVELNSFLV